MNAALSSLITVPDLTPIVWVVVIGVVFVLGLLAVVGRAVR